MSLTLMLECRYIPDIGMKLNIQGKIFQPEFAYASMPINSSVHCRMIFNRRQSSRIDGNTQEV